MATKKFDFKREYPELYNSSTKKVQVVEVPEMKFFMIDGKGDPNSASAFAEAVECLYTVSYALKMKIVKKQTPGKDYVVPPLEGLWHMDDMSQWSTKHKEKWEWTMMMRIPDFITTQQIETAQQLAKESKDPIALSKMEVNMYDEGLCVQIKHIGSYDSEAENIKKIHDFAKQQGYILAGKHHEIYLNDPRRVSPDKLKTILRQPMKK